MKTPLNNDTALALFQQDLIYIKQSLEELKICMKDIAFRYLTKEEAEIKIKELHREIEIDSKIIKLKVDILEKILYGICVFICYQIGSIIIDMVKK